MEIFVGKAEIKSTNVFQAKQLYVELHDWLVEFNYASQVDPKFPEKLIWEARKQNGSKEVWIWWRPHKVIEGNKFWRRVINIDFHGVGITPVEVMYKGKKIKCDKGKFELLMQAKLEIDIGGKFQNSKLLGAFWEVFYKRIFRKEIDMYRREVLNDLKTIQGVGRRFFDLGAFAVDKVGFMPAKGYEEKEF